MKKGLLLIVAGCATMFAKAQNLNELPHWSAELNVSGGSLQQTLTTINFVSAYPGAVNAHISSLEPVAGSSMGGNLQLGYFIGKKRHFGFSAGIMYLQQAYSVDMNSFHVEYKSTDFMGQTFRQLLTADAPVQEKITTTNINIPLLLKYQTSIGKKWGIMLEAGALFNMKVTNAYNTNASFDYEAIYDIEQIDGKNVAVYDNSPTPNSSDWQITKAQYNKNNSDGKAAAFMNGFRALGYNVGLDVSPNHTTGNTSYNTGSFGFMAQPSITYNIGKNLFLNLGFFYMMQSFNNDASSGYMITNTVGSYNSLLNGVKSSVQSTYGGTLGIRYFFGAKKKADMKAGEGMPKQ
jgi:hypothetical protein